MPPHPLMVVRIRVCLYSVMCALCLLPPASGHTYAQAPDSPIVVEDTATASSRVNTNDRQIVTMLVHLDTLLDTPDNREVFDWSSQLIQSNIMVEYTTASGSGGILSPEESPLVADIEQSNSVLRPSPSLNASNEEVGRFMQYVNKFDIVLSMPCFRQDQDKEYSEGKRVPHHECWERVIRVMSSTVSCSANGPQESEDISSCVAPQVGPKTLLYLPESAQTMVCSSDMDLGQVVLGGEMVVRTVMTRTLDTSRCLFQQMQKLLNLNDPLSDSSSLFSLFSMMLVLNVDIVNLSLQVSQWSMWYVEDKKLQSMVGSVDDLLYTQGSLMRSLLHDVFSLSDRKLPLDDVEAMKVGFDSLSSCHQGSFDLPISTSPAIQLGNISPISRPSKRISVLVTESALYIKPILFSYLSRAFPYHNIVFFEMTIGTDFAVKEHSEQEGVYQVSGGSSIVVPDILVWQYGYVGGDLEPGGNIDSWSKHYVAQLYGQWLTVNPNINILYLSGEAKEFVSFFGEKHFLPRAMIEATASVDDQEGTVAHHRKAGILFLNTVKDEQYYPKVSSSIHCPSENHDCLTPDIMLHLSTVATSFFESFDPVLPYTPLNPGTKEFSNSNVLDLLMPRGLTWARRKLQNRQSKFTNAAVAYLYHRCDRYEREHMFRLLLAEKLGLKGRVHALGLCNGGLETQPRYVKLPNHSHGELASRDDVAFSHSAVDQYSSFKFVIAFENTFVEGYITEKLTNAYFAAAVPIYLGPPDVYDYFRKESMINCHEFDSLEDCAEYVSHVDKNDDEYLSILKEAPMANMTQWCQLFNWHPLALDKCTLTSTYRVPLAMRRNFRVS